MYMHGYAGLCTIMHAGAPAVFLFFTARGDFGSAVVCRYKCLDARKRQIIERVNELFG
jgi:hypothetical protein